MQPCWSVGHDLAFPEEVLSLKLPSTLPGWSGGIPRSPKKWPQVTAPPTGLLGPGLEVAGRLLGVQGQAATIVRSEGAPACPPALDSLGERPDPTCLAQPLWKAKHRWLSSRLLLAP